MIERRIGAVVGALLTVFFLSACVTPAPKGQTDGPALADGKARVFFLRQNSVFQSGKPAELEINGTTVAKLRNRDYTFVDLPEGEHHFVVSVFPHTGAFRSGLQLKTGQMRFLLVRPDTRQDDRRPLFRESRRFDIDGGQFEVHEVGPESGEDYRRAMQYRPPLAVTPPPLKRQS
ncbi:MAG: hypothetical protein CMM59_15375 [Rhodospirillaceae bacterium]|nr:hypothetical protein [Rhodospirillaceae bacterium]